MRPVLALFLMVLSASAASAQVIYLPVQYQYGQGEQYYYGGSDPYVFKSAERVSALQRLRGVSEVPVRVYSDLIPCWNARLFGYTVTDARNDAYLSVPRFFRKSDLLEGAVEIDGATYVPPAPPVRYVPAAMESAIDAHRAPERKSGVIIIIPKDNLRRKVDAKPAMFVSAS